MHLQDTSSTKLDPHPRARVRLAHINQIRDNHRAYPQIPATSSTLQGHQARHHAQLVSSSLSVASNHALLPWQVIMYPKRGRCPKPRARQVITNRTRAWKAAYHQTLVTSFLHQARYPRVPVNPVTTSQREVRQGAYLPIPGTTSLKPHQLSRPSALLDKSRSSVARLHASMLRGPCGCRY